MIKTEGGMTRTAVKCVVAGAIAGFGVWAINAGPAEDDAVAAAKAKLAELSNPAAAWDGPTSGPPLAKKMSIVLISVAQAVDVVNGWAKGIEKAATHPEKQGRIP